MSTDAAKMMQFEKKKSSAVAYLLWFFFGMLDAHRFYLGHTGSAVAILLLTIFSFILSVVGIGLVIIFIPAIWVLIDVFLIPGMAREYNNRLIAMLNP